VAERLAWQIAWHERKLGEAEHWLDWAHLPEESLSHWRLQRKLHRQRLDALRQTQLGSN
jgi:hypothetical protein